MLLNLMLECLLEFPPADDQEEHDQSEREAAGLDIFHARSMQYAEPVQLGSDKRR